MANAFVYTPGATPYLTLNGTAVANLIEVFFVHRLRPAQTVESGAVSTLDVEVQLDYTYYLAADLSPILLQGGVVGASWNPLSTAGISPNASGIHRPVRKGKAAAGDTIALTISGQTINLTVGVINATAADALGQVVFPDTDSALAIRPAP